MMNVIIIISGNDDGKANADENNDEDEDKKYEPGEKRPGLPEYRAEEVMTHDTK